jgi:hypothetical protein
MQSCRYSISLALSTKTLAALQVPVPHVSALYGHISPLFVVLEFESSTSHLLDRSCIMGAIPKAHPYVQDF